MNRSRFSPLLENLDRTINLQEAFNSQHFMNELSDLMPKLLSGVGTDDPKDSLILSLHETLKQHRNFVEMMPIGLMLHRAGRIIYTNPGYRRLLGYDNAEELINQSVMVLVSPEDREKIENRIHNLMNKKTDYNGPMEHEALKKNGERIHVETEAVAIMHEGEPAIVVITRDISLRKKAQQDLRKSEENFINMIGQMPDGIMIKDENQVLFTNGSFAKMLGYDSSEELKGMESLQLVHPDFRTASQERLQKLLNNGGSNPLCQFKMLGKEGKVVDVETSSIAIEYFGQKAVMAVLRDTTLQNQMERQAVLNDKLATLGTMAAGVAHEINNPLTYLLGNLDFLKEQVAEIKVWAEHKGFMDTTRQNLLTEMDEELTDITRGGERIRDIVKGLKTFVRGNEETVEKADLNQIVESAIDLTMHAIKNKARLEKDMAVDLPDLTVNAGKLQQVVINLLINAAQAIDSNCPTENKIRVRTGRQNGSLFVEVTDTGKGIPETALPRIFEPFFTTKPAGVGLGLSVCNEILRRYEGTLEVRSQVGMGTTFVARLPLENGFKAKAVDPGLPVEKKSVRVLVVDDEPGNLEVLSRSLKKEYEVLSAMSGVEAMAILEKDGGRIDAIVSDINMPEMDGIALYHAVSQKFPRLEKKLVFITGGIFAEDVAAFLKSVPNVCIEKPFSHQDLRAAVAQCVVSKIVE
jgi:PAS domain S-box-containing protein